MPTVASYGTRKVGTAPLPGVRKQAAETAISTGAGVEQAKAQKGNAIAGIGDTISHVAAQQAEHYAQQADDTVYLAANTALGKWINDKTSNPETGFQTVHGKDTLGLSATVGAEFDAYADSLAATLKTDRQRAMFARARAQHAVNLDGDVERYTFAEVRNYENDELKSSIATRINAAQINAQDPRRIAQELNGIQADLQLHGPRVGMSPETVTLAIAAARSKVHVGVINNLLASDQHKDAADYFEEVKDQIAGDQIDQMTRAVHEGSVRGDAQQQSDAIIKAGGTLTEQREKAKEIKDPEVRDRALDYIEHEDLLRRRDAQVKDEDLMVTAGNLIDKGGIKAVPPGLWAQLTPSQKTGLEQYAKRNLTGGTGDETKARYFDLKSMALNDPAKFIGVNLRNDLAKLSKTELSELLELQDHIRKGDKPKAEAMLDGFRTNNQIVDDTLDIAGIARTGPKADDKSVAQFRRTLDEKVTALQHLSGKKATNKDVQQLADDLLKSVVTQKGSWLNILPGGQPFSDVTKRVSDLTVNDIPANDRAQIEQALRTHGRPVTADAILNLYLDTKRRLGELK